MMSLIDLFKGFHCEAIKQEFPTSARTLFDTLLYKFNANFWTDELVLSERDLTQLTSLPKTTLNEAKHFLASRHIIKVTQFKNKTAYSLNSTFVSQVTDQSPTTNRPLADRSSENPNNACAIDVKTLRQNQSIACEKVEELDALLDYWGRDLHGGRLSFEHQSKLSALMKERGADWLKAAMKEASDTNNNPRGLSPKFLFGVIARKTKEPPSAKKAARLDSTFADIAAQMALTGQRSD